jgi:hypothetical protein
MIDGLLIKYARFGATRQALESLFNDGLRQGFTLEQVEVGIRWGYAHDHQTNEQFTVKDIMLITGETEAEVIARIEALTTALQQTR